MERSASQSGYSGGMRPRLNPGGGLVVLGAPPAVRSTGN